ncbi:c-type cytochrome [Zoogloea sp.]|uniref:c-type cytochrome n=1 Tax=Zoogloea sp. TaxID=49181 RepID=UPI0026300C37|nr:c-type cytochrome [Zoogloea sp.]MDD3353544.1 c-type cytochrome [Zoogloea sp.]
MKGRRVAVTLVLGVVFVQVGTAADLKRAEEIVGGRCFLCHGMEGENASALYPRLAGQHAQYIARQLSDFKNGQRQSETMTSMVSDLTPGEMDALGRYFENKQPGRETVSDSELTRLGQIIFASGKAPAGVASCASCHGEKGHGTAQLPRLAGQHVPYLENRLKQGHKQARTNDSMAIHAGPLRLTELEVKAVSAYMAILQ